jgi:hypothetical protein
MDKQFAKPLNTFILAIFIRVTQLFLVKEKASAVKFDRRFFHSTKFKLIIRGFGFRAMRIESFG